MSIQPDLTLLTSRLARLVDELRAARQQLQALEFSQQTQALEQAAFAADPSLAPVQKTVGGGDPLRDALAAAQAELSRAATPVAEITDGTPVPHPTAATASLATPCTEPPPLPEVWEPVLPKAHPPLEFFPETPRATGRATQFQREAAAPDARSARSSVVHPARVCHGPAYTAGAHRGVHRAGRRATVGWVLLPQIPAFDRG